MSQAIILYCPAVILHNIRSTVPVLSLFRIINDSTNSLHETNTVI